jgi:plastocyanin
MMNTVTIRINITGDEKEPPTITFEPNPVTVTAGQHVIFEVEDRSTNPATDDLTVLLDGFQQGGPAGPRLFGDGVWNNTYVMHDIDPTATEESNPVRGGVGTYSYGAVLFDGNGNKITEDRRPQIIVGNVVAGTEPVKPRSASPAASPSPSPSPSATKK